MNCIKRLRSLLTRSSPKQFPRAFTSSTDDKVDETRQWPRKIFSGIQPTGSLHLGNYLGAVQKWAELQNSGEDVTYCIVDLHSITVPQDPETLRNNIIQMTATMLACGIDPNKSTVFLQSTVKEHTELNWILGCLTTMARLRHLPQYKEKTQKMKEIPLGLFLYPVLQAADILLYKTTHVPVGEDQVQHIQLTQHLGNLFNNRFGTTFPDCHAIIDKKEAARIRSLRDPSKKMSKSDPEVKSCIYLTDEPDVIVEKIKKAVTDFTSEVTYDPENRMGVSNLVAIHSLVSNGKSTEEICKEVQGIDTGKYKMVVAEAVVEHLKPIRTKINEYLKNPSELVYILEEGREKAQGIAEETMAEVKQKVGLGANLSEFSVLKTISKKM
ncbi:tryptophan--tRNA ligase, mitochondrial [Episyrphus balteatus]|uniref:tryptophan--tRNA ligase, mitochondrial n=1 Tax=Episyrphus balteatus TaxID=286459 RepID=UPI0024862D49|nr:tryptophan--tRNA ligase, mitochondrial [Episyrphus balteatus]